MPFPKPQKQWNVSCGSWVCVVSRVLLLLESILKPVKLNVKLMLWKMQWNMCVSKNPTSLKIASHPSFHLNLSLGFPLVQCKRETGQWLVPPDWCWGWHPVAHQLALEVHSGWLCLIPALLPPSPPHPLVPIQPDLPKPSTPELTSFYSRRVCLKSSALSWSQQIIIILSLQTLLPFASERNFITLPYVAVFSLIPVWEYFWKLGWRWNIMSDVAEGLIWVGATG